MTDLATHISNAESGSGKMPTMHVAPAQSDVTIAAVLDSLKFDVEHLRAERTRPGWTTWALLGSLATCLYLLAGEIGKGVSKSVPTQGLLIAFCMGIDSIQMIRSLLTPATAVTRPGRFSLARRMMENNRLLLLYVASRALALILLAHAISGTVGSCPTYLAYAFYSVLLAVGVLLFLASYSRWPVPHSSPNWRSASILALLTCTGVTATAAYIGFFFNRSLIGADYVRSAGLGAASVFLIEMLASGTSHLPLLPVLVDLRRDLALGRIGLNAAIRQSEIIFAGMEVADVVQEDVAKLLAIVEQMERLSADGVKELDVLVAKTGPLSACDLVVAQAILRSCDQRTEAIGKLVPEMKVVGKKLGVRLKILASSKESAQGAILEVQNRVVAALDAMPIDSLHAKTKLLRERVRSSEQLEGQYESSG